MNKQGYKVYNVTSLQVTISEICSLLDVDGIRGDITTNKAARALAAYEGETVVTLDHVRRVVGLCLTHRCAARACLGSLFRVSTSSVRAWSYSCALLLMHIPYWRTTLHVLWQASSAA